MHKFLALCLFLLILIGYVSTAVGGILFYDDCEDTPNVNDWQFQNKGSGNKFYVSSEHPFAGSKSYKYYNHGAVSSARVEHALVTDAITGSSHHFKYNKKYWIGYAFYLTSDSGYQNGNYTQFHGVPDTCDNYRKGIFTISPNYETGLPIVIRHMGQKDFCGNVDGAPVYDRNSFPKSSKRFLEDAWNTVVLEIVFNYSTGGVFNIWLNGELINADTGINCYYDADGPYFKIGIYGTFSGGVTAYYDEIRVGDENSSYDEVSPKGPKTISLNAPLLKIVN